MIDIGGAQRACQPGLFGVAKGGILFSNADIDAAAETRESRMDAVGAIKRQATAVE